MRAYHFLREDMTAASGNEPPWKVGEERTVKGDLVMCEHGYHSSPSWLDSLQYAPGPIACIVEIPKRGTKHDTDKQVSRKRKLIAAVDATTVLRLFACDCAERALTAEREAGREPDKRSWTAIEVARRFAEGNATLEELSAARSAAWMAARSRQSTRLTEMLDALFQDQLSERGE